jgi:glyoxylase I family protein
MPLIDHADLVVSSIERSLPFYRGLLGPLGWVGVATQEGEQGERIHYLGGADLNGSLGLREGRSAPVDRYEVGLHHLAFEAPNRAAVDQAAEYARAQGCELDGEPGERHYTPAYYAVFFFDPDHIKIEVVHRPRPFSLSFARGLVRGSGSIVNQVRRRRARRAG